MADSKTFLLQIDWDGNGVQQLFDIILDDDHKVWIAAFEKKIVKMPGCNHSSNSPHAPTPRDTLDLRGLGNILGVTLPPAPYSQVGTGGRSGFFHRHRTGLRSPGDWEASDSGGGLGEKK